MGNDICLIVNVSMLHNRELSRYMTSYNRNKYTETSGMNQMLKKFIYFYNFVHFSIVKKVTYSHPPQKKR